MKNRPLLEAFLGEELDEIERVFQLGENGKHFGSEPKRDFNFQMKKMSGHFGKTGILALNVDEETGVEHFGLAAIRALLAWRDLR